MSANSDDESNLPSREECEKRCQEFADVTGTDTALAMFYLQDRDWDVQRSLNAFFNEQGVVDPSGNNHKTVPTVEPDDSSDNESVEAIEVDPEPNRIRLLSWNIDGLDTNNINNRTKGVCNVITQEKPDVIFLQEVIPETFAYLEAAFDDYHCISAGAADYFTAMMFRRSTAKHESQQLIPFYTSMMLRNILKVKAVVKGLKFELLTSHLESTKSHADERIKQLKIAFKEMRDADGERTVIFGGDLNLRDTELVKVGGVPENLYDLWEVTGKRPEAKFTWDTMRNDNCQMEGGRFKPRCRFDRLYLRHDKTAAKVKPVYFELVGIERLKSCQRFPSDHWGILVHFDKK